MTEQRKLTSSLTPPDVVRAAYLDLVVTDLAAAREFYVGILGLVITKEDDHAIYLRTFEEFIHHNLVLRTGPVAGAAALAFRVRTAGDVDRAEAYYRDLGCPVQRQPQGFVDGIGDAVRVIDPLGFPYEFFYACDHVERLSWAYHRFSSAALARFDHFNQFTPDVPSGCEYLRGLGFGISEDIQDSDGVVYAVWLYRKQTVHDTALTGGHGPRLHHIAFNTHERNNILDLCDRLGALRRSDLIERGPGRHGVSNAFYLYLRDQDGHRIEIYTQDYYTGDPDTPRVTWDVHDNQRRDWWGNAVVPSWYRDGSLVFDLDGHPQPVIEREERSEMNVTIGADGFSYTREGDTEHGFKIGHSV